MKKSIVWPLAVLVYLCATTCFAQEGKSPWEEYDKLINARKSVTALGPDLFGDHVDLQTGTLSFSATDVSIPGNSKLPVAFTRSFTVSNRKGYYSHDLPLGDWNLDVPRLSGVFAANWHDQRCSIANPPAVFAGDRYFQADEFWQGNQADMPGGGRMLRVISGNVIPTTGGPYLWMTSGNTYFSCLATIKNGTGQGFLAVTADGTKYWFDWMVRYEEPSLDSKTQNGLRIYLARRKNVLYATRVEDRFGNWVTYTYTGSKLTAINSNDGRQLTIGYNANGYVDTVSDGTHSWTYQYTYPTSTTGTLNAVIQPDTSKWSIDFAALADAQFRYHKSLEPQDPWRDCFNPGDLQIDEDVTGIITHPSGAVGQFTVSVERHGRSNVPALCGNYSTPSNDPNDDVAYYPINWDSYSLVSKTVSGPGLTTATWTYSYGSAVSWFYPASGGGLPVCGSSSGCQQPTCTSDACAGTDVTMVTGPDSHYTRYTFGNSYRYNEGKLLKVEEGSTTAILRTTSKAYNLAQSGQPFPTPAGTDPQSRGDGFTSEYLRPQSSNVVAQDGVNFSSTVSSFDSFARPLSTTKSSSLGYSKTEATTYSDNLSKWVLGQIASVTDTETTKVISQTDYDAATALPLRQYAFGNPQPLQTLTYNSDGTVATVKDGNNNVTTLSSWKRGIPQLISHPATPDSPSGSTESAFVNDFGWIESSTDENAFTHNYTYDAMGRLATIAYPTGDSTVWNNTIQNFVRVNSIEYGIPAGHWRQIVHTGTGLATTYFDGQWRPVLKVTEDTANPSSKSFVVTRYDSSGRSVFTSYPVASLATVNDSLSGTVTTYDALDRSYQVKQDSELGVLTTTTEYLPGFKTRVTNPRTYSTTTSYQVFDSPSTETPVLIESPGGVTTTIVRDDFGKPKSITRSGPGA